MKTNSKKKMQPEIPVQEAELLNHRFWTVRVPPDTLTVLGNYIVSGTMVLKNYGMVRFWTNWLTGSSKINGLAWNNSFSEKSRRQGAFLAHSAVTRWQSDYATGIANQ
jgi:hypothetical protein